MWSKSIYIERLARIFGVRSASSRAAINMPVLDLDSSSNTPSQQAANHTMDDLWPVLEHCRAECASLRRAHHDLREELLQKLEMLALRAASQVVKKQHEKGGETKQVQFPAADHAMDAAQTSIFGKPSAGDDQFDFGEPSVAVVGMANLEQGIDASPTTCSTHLIHRVEALEVKLRRKSILQEASKRTIDVDEPPTRHQMETRRKAIAESYFHLARTAIAELKHKISHKVEESLTSPLESSVWELVTIAGAHGIPMRETILAAFLITFNVLLQALVCAILMNKFTDHEKQSAQTWRFEVGHWEKYATSSGRSMVDRLCTHDMALELSGAQRTVMEHVESWLSPFAGWYSGLTLVLWCLLIWFLHIWKDLQVSFDRLTCILVMPGGVLTCICPTKNGFILASMTTGRKVAAVCVTFLRVGVALVIAYAGSVWLVRTTEIEELLLNSVALVFVLDIDDVLFKTACPRTMRVMILNMEPLHHSCLPMYKVPLPVRSFATMVGCITFLICFYQAQLISQRDEILRLDTSFCGGNKDFVVGVNAVTGIVISYEGHTSQTSKSLMSNVAKDLAASVQKKDHIKASSWDQFQSYLLMDEKTSIEAYGKCKDVSPDEGFLMAPLRHAINERLSSCRDLNTVQCTNAPPIIRLACPVTCGCDRPRAGSFSLQGCPMDQCTSMKNYTDTLRSERTADIHVDILSRMPEWHLYWNGFVRVATDRAGFNVLHVSPASIAATFTSIGCEGIAYFQKNSTPSTAIDFFCSEKHKFRRPLRSFCPASCKCPSPAVRNDRFCPQPQMSPIVSCASVSVGMAYSGPHLNRFRPTVATSQCNQSRMGNSTDPIGQYICRPYGYNGKHEYIFSDLGVQWIIRWETKVNLDWAPMYIGAGIDLSGGSMWTLSSMKIGQIEFGEYRIASRWFNVNQSRFPPEHGWLPRNSSNSDADCAWHQIRVWGAADFVMTPAGGACPSGYFTIMTEIMCQHAAQRLHIAFKHIWPRDDRAFGCHLDQSEVEFNTNSLGRATTSSAIICWSNRTR